MSSKGSKKSNSGRNRQNTANNSQSNKNSSRRSQPPPSYNGVYQNKSMCHVLTAVVGEKCHVRVKNEENIYEGFFHCFSPTMDLIISAAHKVNKGCGDVPIKNEIIDDMIFPIDEVVNFTFERTDLQYAVEDSFTDNAISTKDQCKIDTDEKYNNLEEWKPDAGYDDSKIDGDLGEIGPKVGGSGWNAEEMFRTNKDKFQLSSTYDPKLTGYTVSLEKEDTPEFKQRSRRAHLLASEIEGSANYQQTIHHELDENQDEETKFSAVDETGTKDNQEGQKGKYIPPSRRPTDTPVQQQSPGINGNARPIKQNQPPSVSQNSTNQRNQSRENDKNKGGSRKSVSQNQQQNISTNNVSPSNKKGTDIKKDTRSRASPTQGDKGRNQQQVASSQGNQRTQPNMSNQNSGRNQSGTRSWSNIAGGSVTGAQKVRNTPSTATGGMGNQQINVTSAVNLSTGPDGKRTETTETLKRFSNNFNLKEPEKNQSQLHASPQIQNVEKVAQSQTSTAPPPTLQTQPTQQASEPEPVPNSTQHQNTKRKTTPPPGMAPKPSGPPPGIKEPKSEEKQETPKKSTKLNPNAQEWRPNVAAPAFKPSYGTPKQPALQPTPQQPSTPVQPIQSPPVPINQVPQQPHYVPQTQYHPQPPIYPYPQSQVPYQTGAFVQPISQPIMHPQQQVTYAQSPQMAQNNQGQNQGPKQRPSGPNRQDNRGIRSGDKTWSRRHQGPQNSSPHSSISAGGMVQPGQQANMIPQNIGPYHQGHVPNQGQPMMVGNVYGQPEMVGVPPMQHVGIQQRPFEQSSYPPSFPQQQMPQTPTSQGPGHVVYHSGHPSQPGPNQISMPPGAPAGAIIHYQLATPNGQQPGGMPMGHPVHYAPPRPQGGPMMPPGQGQGPGGYAGQQQPGQHPGAQAQH